MLHQASGAPQKCISLFQNTYDEAESCVRVNGEAVILTFLAQIAELVHQCSVTVPELFNTLTDYLITTVTLHLDGLALGHYTCIAKE